MTVRGVTEARPEGSAHGAVAICDDRANPVDRDEDGSPAGEAEQHEINHDVRDLSAKRPARLALAFGLLALTVLAGLIGWLGFHSYDATRHHDQHASFLAAGRESAARLTTISPDQVEADVERILASSTGQFYEDFQQRSPSLIEMVKQAQSKTEGTVVEAGLEAIRGDGADVLVAVSVKPTLAGAEAPARVWRIRIGLERVDETEKVSHVEYVA